KNFAQELEKKVAERTIELKKLNDYLQLKNNIFAHAEENAMAGSYSWNLQTNDLEYSDNLFRMLGCEPQEFVPSFEKFLNFIHPDDIELVADDGQKTFENQMIVQHIYRVITKTGTIKFFRSSGNFTGEDDNRFMVGSVQDVTKDTLMNEVLTKKNLELKHNNAELESFTYIASHDLQEPLRKIQSFSKLILTKELANLSATSNDYFSRIIAAAQRMQHLIDALLNYSSSNSLDNQSLPTDLNGIIDEVIYNLNDIIEEKKAIIEKADLPKLNVVQVQFYQLFSNIISNALKYSRPHIVPLIKISANIIAADEIKTGTTDKKGKYWKITIADNGIGFDQQYEFKIFELFQRLHGRNEYEGTGIGLAICNKIVHNHNGFIVAAGHPGVGAEFTIYLPMAN
ncbi:MAG: PAS domain-containing protein, partial [Ferruginibacter sp.]|nr:PAS domain-containing protein [Ferruginibacter sp.]